MLTDLELQAVELLVKGSIRPILGGRRFIHRVTYLSRPTVTLTVRTINTGSTFRQYSYLYPSIGIEVSDRLDEQDQLSRKRRRCLSFLATIGHLGLESYVKQLVERSDARDALKYVAKLNKDAALHPLEHFGLLNRLLEQLEARYGAWIDKFGSALEHQIKEGRVNWQQIHEVDQDSWRRCSWPCRAEGKSSRPSRNTATRPTRWAGSSGACKA